MKVFTVVGSASADYDDYSPNCWAIKTFTTRAAADAYASELELALKRPKKVVPPSSVWAGDWTAWHQGRAAAAEQNEKNYNTWEAGLLSSGICSPAAVIPGEVLVWELEVEA